jgi:predicted methyltransferase
MMKIFGTQTKMSRGCAMVLLAILVGCSSDEPGQTESSSSSNTAFAETPAATSLLAILERQDEAVKARYDWRHPAQTLAFFGIKPGMTVVEALPEGGWYSRILYPYLGAEGALIGADYALDMYPKFNFYSDEELAAKATWATDWPLEVAAWGDAGGSNGAATAAFNFGALPESLEGQADAILFVRALHNMSAFEADGGYLSTAINDAYRVLKSGGVAGVVQHMGPESASDAWSTGVNGYLKKSAVVRAFESAGFVLTAESPINENPLDQPTEDDYVWRLAPTSEEFGDPQLDAANAAIGESSRMTLRFEKP